MSDITFIEFVGGPLDGERRIIPDEGTIDYDVIQVYVTGTMFWLRHTYGSQPPHRAQYSLGIREIKVDYIGIEEDESQTGTPPISLSGRKYQE